MDTIEKSLIKQKTRAFLKGLGLNKTESEILNYLLNTDGATVAQIVRIIEIPRTTVIRNLAKLQKKVLVNLIEKNSEKKYYAENLRKVENIIRDREQKIETDMEQVNELKKQLPEFLKTFSVGKKESDDVVVKYYEGIKGFREVHDRTLNYAIDEVLFFSNHNEWRSGALDLEYDNNIYVPQRVAKKIQNRSLVLKNEMGIELKESAGGRLRSVKYLPDELDFNTTFIIYKDNVAIMVSEKPYIAINIRSKEVYKTFKNIFEYFWDGGE